MLTAEEANSLASIENKPVKVSEQCDKALDKSVLEAIEKWKSNVRVVLWYEDCPDEDITIKNYLKQLWYKEVKVTSDYPSYCESYKWTTTIIFNL